MMHGIHPYEDTKYLPVTMYILVLEFPRLQWYREIGARFNGNRSTDKMVTLISMGQLNKTIIFMINPGYF